jgi:hypothetical protein
MKLCTTTKVTGNDQEEHFAVVAVGQPGWPLALCGKTKGSMSKQSEAYAKLFADASAMLDLLEALYGEFSNINANFPLSAGKLAFLGDQMDRAKQFLNKHIPNCSALKKTRAAGGA